jgi:hypothetical protein
VTGNSYNFNKQTRKRKHQLIGPTSAKETSQQASAERPTFTNETHNKQVLKSQLLPTSANKHLTKSTS